MRPERRRRVPVAELRQAFDLSFAEAPASEAAAVVDLLDIRVVSTPYALRLAELSGLFADVSVTPVPTRVAELLGIAGHRGAILPVYDLRALLGHPAGPHPLGSKPRWIAVAAAVPVGVAFDVFEGHLRVRQDSIVARGDLENTTHAREVVPHGGVMRSIVSLSSVLDTITSRVRAGARDKE